MNRPYVSSKNAGLTLLLTSVILVVSACGKFTAKENLSQRPPTSADPLKAENSRRWKAGIELAGITDSPLRGNKEVKDFYETLTEEAPTMTDDQRAEEAQIQWDADQKEKADKAAAQKLNDKIDQSADSGTSADNMGTSQPHDWAPGPGAAKATDDQTQNPLPGTQVGVGTTTSDDAGSALPTTNTPNNQAQTSATQQNTSAVQPVGDLPSVPSVPTGANDAPKEAGGPARPVGDLPSVPQVPQTNETSNDGAHDQAPGPKSVSTTQGRNTEHTAAGPISKPAAAPQVKPAVAAVPPRKVVPAKPPVAPLMQNICQLIKASSNGQAVDLSNLYGDDAKLAATMPSEQLKALQSQDKKNLFVCTLLPIAVRMDMEVYAQRLEILRLQAKQKQGNKLSTGDISWLSDIKTQYNLKPTDSYADLLLRVDIIPLPMLLAQAALETGWGTSAATRDLKNLFGIHQGDSSQDCARGYDTNNACVRRFKNITQGVAAYFLLLNSDRNYVKFRNVRGQLRAAAQKLDSVALVGALGNYNETPTQYINLVRSMMAEWNKSAKYTFNEQAAADNAPDARKTN